MMRLPDPFYAVFFFLIILLFFNTVLFKTVANNSKNTNQKPVPFVDLGNGFWQLWLVLACYFSKRAQSCKFSLESAGRACAIL